MEVTLVGAVTVREDQIGKRMFDMILKACKDHKFSYKLELVEFRLVEKA